MTDGLLWQTSKCTSTPQGYIQPVFIFLLCVYVWVGGCVCVCGCVRACVYVCVCNITSMWTDIRWNIDTAWRVFLGNVPSLISLTVSVDVKHHVYLLTWKRVFWVAGRQAGRSHFRVLVQVCTWQINKYLWQSSSVNKLRRHVSLRSSFPTFLFFSNVSVLLFLAFLFFFPSVSLFLP